MYMLALASSKCYSLLARVMHFVLSSFFVVLFFNKEWGKGGKKSLIFLKKGVAQWLTLIVHGCGWLIVSYVRKMQLLN